jgi:hypothetical protein
MDLTVLHVPYSLDSGLALVKLRTELDVGKKGLKIHNSRGAHDLLPERTGTFGVSGNASTEEKTCWPCWVRSVMNSLFLAACFAERYNLEEIRIASALKHV